MREFKIEYLKKGGQKEGPSDYLEKGIRKLIRSGDAELVLMDNLGGIYNIHSSTVRVNHTRERGYIHGERPVTSFVKRRLEQIARGIELIEIVKSEEEEF